MKLLHFAHRAEAQQFIAHFEVKLDSTLFSDVYVGKDLIIVISGEGTTKTHNKIAFLLGKFSITKIINLGIAGVLDKNINLDQVVKVRTSYAYLGSAKFHSYTSCESNSYDCITTDERILNSTNANKLRPFAHLVDRELWSLASCAKLLKLPFESFKYLSDYAGDDTQCLDIKNRAQFFSQKLLEAYLDSPKDENINEIKQSCDFYMTFSQKHQFEKLIDALKIKWECSQSEVLKKINAKEILKKEIQPKVKTTILLKELENALTPLKKILEEKLNKSVMPLTSCGAQVTFDKALEKKEFMLRMTINGQTNVKKLSRALEEFSFDNFENIMDGDFDV